MAVVSKYEDIGCTVVLEHSGDKPKSTPLLYRDAETSDIDEMTRFIFDHGPNRWNYLPRSDVTAHLEQVRHGRTSGVVAIVGNQLVGFTTYTFDKRLASYESRECRDLDHGHILEVVVHRHLGGRGIGTELLRQCVDRILSRGASAVYIDRHEENAPSAAIMRKAGFVEIKTYVDSERRTTGSRRSTICRYVPGGAA